MLPSLVNSFKLSVINCTLVIYVQFKMINRLHRFVHILISAKWDKDIYIMLQRLNETISNS